MFGRKNEEDGSQRIKQAMLSAAHRALEYKKLHPHASDHEVLDYVVRTSNELLNDLD